MDKDQTQSPLFDNSSTQLPFVPEAQPGVPQPLEELSGLVETLDQIENPSTEIHETPPSFPVDCTVTNVTFLPCEPTATPVETQGEPSGIAVPADDLFRQSPTRERELAFSRLGVSNGLFVSLQAKHIPTASHCLRVALSSSAWAEALGLTCNQRAMLEAGALLHDVGKIGVPDTVLFKSTRLDREDLAQLDRYRQFTLEILAASGATRELVDTVFYASAWYDGSRRTYELRGEELPITSRMLAIVDAYDSMTTDQAHRRARSTDEAIGELFSFAGTQFDPQLVKQFATFVASQPKAQHLQLASSWLQDLAEREGTPLWSDASILTAREVPTNLLFHQQLVDSLGSAVIFVDTQSHITHWNAGAERLFGIPFSGVHQKTWVPSLMRLQGENNEEIRDTDCPVAKAMKLGEACRLKGTVNGRGNRRVHVEMSVGPVINNEGIIQGAVIVLDDLSSHVTMSRRLEALNLRVAVDPLTKVANRAEIDRVHAELVQAASDTTSPFGMIICDLDFFKTINDEYGHPAGDEALMVFASLLKRFKRPGDLVGRYGGEEFVMLCVDSDLACCAERAEAIRTTLSTTRLPVLNHKSMTASFGVTQLMPGDTPETMLRRADRALLRAKETGRNRVIQLGGQLEPVEATAPPSESKSLFSWFRSASSEETTDAILVASVPIDLAVEKFRGFVSDHAAQIVRVDGNKVNIKVDGRHPNGGRRQSDRPVPLLVDLEFSEVESPNDRIPESFRSGTTIRLHVHPIRSRDRRRKDISEQARHLVLSLKSYFMAVELRELTEPRIERAATKSNR